MFCGKCGNKVDGNFCTRCGAPVNREIAGSESTIKSKEEILTNIANDLNISQQKWDITINGSQIIAYWKWKDGIYFSIDSITDEVKEYKFIITLLDNNKWEELVITNDTFKEVNPIGGKASLNKSFFIGKKTQKTFEFSFGKKRGEDKIGFRKDMFDTSLIKNPIRNYLKQSGWNEKGLF